MTKPFTMQALADSLEQTIRQNRLLDFPTTWGNELVFPYYNGLSLLNIPQTILTLFGANTPTDTPLPDAVWDSQTPYGNVQRVIVFLTDGLGYLWLQKLIDQDPEIAEIIADLTQNRGPLPLTSIAPSTTAVALPTLWTGVSAAKHGMLGTTLFLRELSMMGDLLKFKPATGKLRNEIFAEWGLVPENFLPVPTVAERLSQVGVPTHLLLPKELMNTGLSRVLHRGVTHPHIHGGYSDFWLRLQELLHQTAGQKCYVSIYWPAVDTLSHAYGAHTDYLHHEIKFQLSQLRQILNNTSTHDGQTLFMLVADHGHHDVENSILIDEHPQAAPIYDAMRGWAGAETRFSYLYLRNGQAQQVIDTFQAHFADNFTWLNAEEALQAGLFGLDTPYIESIHRLGDLIIIPRLNWQISSNASKFKAISRHGGLSDWEMLIPLVWKRI